MRQSQASVEVDYPEDSASNQTPAKTPAAPLILSELLLPSFLLVFAIFTVSYWIGTLARFPQLAIWLGTIIGVGICWRLFPRGWRSIRIISACGLNLAIAIGFALFCVCVFSTNPDDTTFFHRAATEVSFATALPITDTRLAFDDIPPISAAHLVPSWEYGLVLIGLLFGSPLLGYQIAGTAIAASVVAASIEFTQRRIFPSAPAMLAPAVLCLVLLLLYFDADANRRIGTWLIIGAWTGKCFLAALLLLLFPVWDQFTSRPTAQTRAFLVSLLITLIGLTGSALFILPIGLGCAYLTSAVFLRRSMPFVSAALIAGIPVLVGAAFLLRFGATPDTSYWQNIADQKFSDYALIVLSPRNMIFYGAVALAAISWGILRPQCDRFVIRFHVYQLLIVSTVLNPLLLPVFLNFVPADGFWRAHYLLQYPVAYILLSGAIVLLLSRRQIVPALLLSVFYGGFLASGQPVWKLQQQWNYPVHFMLPGSPKLDLVEQRAVSAAASLCPLETGGVILAPERWEVVAQMTYPKLTSVAARHMAHNFNNVGYPASLDLSEAERIAAAALVSGHGTDAGALDRVISLGVDVIVTAETAPDELGAALSQNGFNKVVTSDGYTVFCKPKI